MQPEAVALLAAAGFGAGLIDAIAGGGGLITLPALLATGLPIHTVFGTNKGQAAFATLSSAASFWSRGGVDRDRAPLSFACGFVGSLAGAALLLAIRPEPLRPIVVTLLLLAAGLVVAPRRSPAGGGAPRAVTAPPPRAALAAIALGLGAYDGFFGPGVGSMLIVLYSRLFGDSLTRASGNAKVVNLASNVAALLVFAARGRVLWWISLPMAIASAAGALVGARLALRRGDRLVRVVVLCVVVCVVSKLAFDMARG